MGIACLGQVSVRFTILPEQPLPGYLKASCTVAGVVDGLSEAGYLADAITGTVVYLAAALGKPVLDWPALDG